MATPAKKGKSPKPKRAKGTKPQHPAGKEFTAYSSSTPQARADAKKEAERKAKIKKMDNAGKEKAAKPVDKAKQRAKEKAMADKIKKQFGLNSGT